MNIAIDCRILNSEFRSGILVYTERLVEHLSQIDSQNRYQLLFSGLRTRPGQIPLSVGPNFHKYVLPFPDRSFPYREEVWRRGVLPTFFALGRTDVFHLPAGHHLPSFSRVKRVYTVHDLRSVHIQDSFAQDLELIRRSCESADRVITVSEFSRRDVIEQFGISEHKVAAVHLGIDDCFRVVDDQAAIDGLKERLGIHEPFLLSLGLVPRKNVDRLVEAFSRFRHRDEITLVLAGHSGGLEVDQLKRRISALGLEQRVLLPGSPSIEDLVLLYNAALGFVFPSLCEGFGIPVLEAMACGVPVITSNLSALPEVAGEAAVLVDPYDVAEIASAMDRLAEDGELRRKLVRTGHKRAAEFSWERMAQSLLREYGSL